MKIPQGFCHCGCGEKTAISKKTDSRHGYVKGEPRKYILGHSRNPYCTEEEREILNPTGMCMCGCGGLTDLATQTHTKKGWIKGQPLCFIPGHNLSFHHHSGEKNPKWKGGKHNHCDGYVGIRMPDHPQAHTSGYVIEHILVAERALGKYLPFGALPHHVNEDKADNRPENLVICQDRAYHNFLHQRMRALNTCGHANWRKCVYCKKYDDPNKLLQYKNKAPFHRDCRNAYDREKP